MSAAPSNERGLMLLLEEYFSNEDDRFLETLCAINSAPRLAALADRWKKDPRPWARKQILVYLELPLNRSGHQPVVKRLFKQAEESKDDELMAAFLTAFDRLVRRERQKSWHWDAQTRDSYEEEVLVTPRNSMELVRGRAFNNTRKDIGSVPSQAPPNAQLFSYHTRFYLRRRAWRYFRRLGFSKPEEYPKAIARALLNYSDEDLAKGENILDSWGLMHACFGKHDALEFQASHIKLKDGHSLSELSPAPYFLQAWQAPASGEILLSLVWQAQSHLVRVWAVQLLCREHRDLHCSMDHVFQMLSHADPEVQRFGAQILEGLGGLEKMPVSFWLRLLQIKTPEVLQQICELIAKTVSPERLELAQCLALACHQASPVARLGLQFLKARTITTPEQRQAILGLADAQCPAVGRELGELALGIVGKPEVYTAETASRFFDSRLREMRAAAWDWLIAGSAGYNDPVLWSRLTETPFDDLRLKLIDQLQNRANAPAPKANELAPVWCSVLLGVHRGGRQKIKAVRQVGEAIERNPGQIDELLPVLAVAVRSVRGPEARAGLSAVVSAVERQPDLARLVNRYLPELDLAPAEVTP